MIKTVFRKSFVTVCSGGKKKKYFDFSSGISEKWKNNLIDSKRIKKNFKLTENFFWGNSDLYLKNKLSLLYRMNPDLEDFYPYFVDDFTLYHYLLDRRWNLKFFDFELNQYSFLNDFNNIQTQAQAGARLEDNVLFLMSDLFFQFHSGRSNEKGVSQKINLVVDSTFPELNDYASSREVETILIAGRHPMYLGNFKLVFSRRKNLFKHITEVQTLNVFYFHLYLEAIKRYFFVKSRHHDKLINEIERAGLKENFQMEFSYLPNLFRIKLGSKKIKLEKKINYLRWPYRFFYERSTFIFKEPYGYFYLPYEMPLNHLEKKWKDLRALMID